MRSVRAMLAEVDRVDPHHHAFCITGLERSFRAISGNLRAALGGLHHGLDRVSWFGVRPPQDPWTIVRERLPPLRAERVQRQCVQGRPVTWFSAYSRSMSAFWGTYHVWTLTLCDQLACDEMIDADEAATGRRYHTVARIRLDLLWETPLRPPPRLEHNVVYIPEMNQKAGMCDKFAFGRREPMRAYLRRIEDFVVAESLFNGSRKAEAAGRGGALTSWSCQSRGQPDNRNSRLCRPVHDAGRHSWQMQLDSVLPPPSPPSGGADAATTLWTNVSKAPNQRAFRMTSEGFLEWALWRHNVSSYLWAHWMFCKYSNVENTNTTARTCVPRVRSRQPCATLHCEGSKVDCVCPMTKVTKWCGSRCTDACKTAMSRAAKLRGEAYGGNRTDSSTMPQRCPSSCYQIGSFAGTCEDVAGMQLDENGNLY